MIIKFEIDTDERDLNSPDLYLSAPRLSRFISDIITYINDNIKNEHIETSDFIDLFNHSIFENDLYNIINTIKEPEYIEPDLDCETL